jgi:hypothetical protein
MLTLGEDYNRHNGIIANGYGGFIGGVSGALDDRSPEVMDKCPNDDASWQEWGTRWRCRCAWSFDLRVVYHLKYHVLTYTLRAC